jgi:hypothetical protein
VGQRREEVQRCKSSDEAREVKRKIMDTIGRHKTTQQVQDLENAIVALLRKNYDRPVSQQPAQANTPAPPPPADSSGIPDPKLREGSEEINAVIERLRKDSERRTAEIMEDIRKMNEFMKALNQAAIEHIHQKASALYRVPRWFSVQWNMRPVARLAVQFLAIEFLIGKVLEKLLESNAPSFLEKPGSTLSEWLITAGVALLLFFLSIPAAKKIDEMFLGSYKRLLQRLVANRVTTYWATYNSLLRIFAGCQAKIAEYKNALLAAEGRVRPPDDKKAS